jgi:hypothetical protein
MYFVIDSRQILRALSSAVLASTITLGIAAAADLDTPRGRNEVRDQQRTHDPSQLRPGASVRHLPRGYRRYYYGGNPYYFHGNIWYSPSRHGFIVVRPPIGLYVPVLPPYSTTVWRGGVPYYYADDTYYQQLPESDKYQIVTPPGATPGVAAPTSPALPSDNVFIYPRNGQSDEQQSSDRYDCYVWSRGQTGFDPVQGAGGVARDQSAPKRAQFNRALNACLEARGYSVK